MPDVSGKARRPEEQNEESKGENPKRRHRGKEGGSGRIRIRGEARRLVRRLLQLSR